MPDLSDSLQYETPQYQDMASRWELIRDCVSGSKAVKAKKDKYLPRPGPDPDSEEQKTRYANYINRAVFYNVSRRTLNGLIGQVFKQPPIHDEFPELLESLIKNVDGGGVSLEQQSQKTLADVIAYGAAGLWTDYPKVEKPATIDEIRKGIIRPTISRYSPWLIPVLGTTRIGNLDKLSLVILKEAVIDEKNSDTYKKVYKEARRVLLLQGGIYSVELWIQEEKDSDKFELKETVTPTDYSGKPFEYIPFELTGSQNNAPEFDQSLLEDICLLNIAHFRNSADYEESVYHLGQPTYWFSGLTPEWVDDILKGKIRLGALGGVMLPVGGSADILQVEPNTLAFEAMEKKEDQMKALGARLVENPEIEQTATEVTLRYSGEVSQLALAANNVSRSYEKVLEFALQFVGEHQDISFQLNIDYDLRNMDAQERAELVNEYEKGVLLLEEVRKELKKIGITSVEEDEFLQKIKLQKAEKMKDQQQLMEMKQSQTENKNNATQSNTN